MYEVSDSNRLCCVSAEWAVLFSEQEVLLQCDATLLLRNVTPGDQGLYFCVTMTARRFEESGVITLVVRGERAVRTTCNNTTPAPVAAPLRDVVVGLDRGALTYPPTSPGPAPPQ